MIVLEIISLVFSALGIVATLTGVNCDTSEEWCSDYEQNTEDYFAVNLTISIVSIVMCIVGLFGAVKFNFCAVSKRVGRL